MSFETWLKQCPDPSRFATEYVDIRSDIQNVIDTYDRPEWKKINFNKDKINIFFKNTDLNTSLINAEDIESKINMTKDVIKVINQNGN